MPANETLGRQGGAPPSQGGCRCSDDPLARRETGLAPGDREARSPGEKNGWLLGTGFGDTSEVRAEVEYSAVVSVKVDLESGEVASVDIRAPGDGDESRSEVRVSVESQTDEAEEVFDHAQQLVDAAAPFKLRGWWAPAPTQRWAPLDDSGKTARAEEDPQLKLRKAAGEGGREAASVRSRVRGRPSRVAPRGAAARGDHLPGRVVLRDRRRSAGAELLGHPEAATWHPGIAVLRRPLRPRLGNHHRGGRLEARPTRQHHP